MRLSLFLKYSRRRRVTDAWREEARHIDICLEEAPAGQRREILCAARRSISEVLKQQFLLLDEVQLDELHRRGHVARGDGVVERVVALLVILHPSRCEVAPAQ